MIPLFDISTHPETRINTSFPNFFHFLCKLCIDDSIKTFTVGSVMKTQKRIAEILGWLSAYRNEWVSFDREHVRSLKAELAELTR